MEYLNGTVLYGINNIYTVLAGNRELRCRIKGKILEEEGRYYNPIASGDRVVVMEDPISDSMGWIVERGERDNGFYRFNRKKKLPQVIASNIDCIMAVCCDHRPPFRPRFIDRIIIAAQIEGIDVVILANKCDLGFSEMTKERLDEYGRIGYRVIHCSAITGKGVNDITGIMEGKLTVFIGQSGVGKSSLLNRIEPDLGLKIGAVSSKYDRGVHTTRFSLMMRLSSGARVIDTPGIREFFLYNLKPEELKYYFPEFNVPQQQCGYSTCLHIAEPDCMVKKHVEEGKILGDRYESYVRIFESLKEMEGNIHG
ncbi:MAG: ribosome small subunit-dependent GTPase A [Spirochaetales bacterium]|nr:ribosome small subunit-dependent GTPase A [Spirochaetales bacterium]